MNPGTLVYDPNFTFRDGVTGQKILAVLNDGACGYYIVVKMTSRPAYKGTVYGCQNNDRYPNFFCPRGSCRLSKDTWIQLDDFFEFDQAHLQSKYVDGSIQPIDILPIDMLRALLRCAIDSNDISMRQARILTATLQGLI